MKNLLSINIRQFEDTETDYIVDGELNIGGIVDSYSENTDAETEAEETEIEETETDTEEPETEISTETEEDPEPETETEVETKNTPDQAFAEMRRQVEANEPLAKWVQDLAVQQGFSDPQDLIKAYDDQRIAKEAEEKGVPVDVYKRLHQLEQENIEAKTQAEESKFNHEVETVKSKHNLTDDQITNVFRYMGQNNLDVGTLPFEQIYILANSETLIQDAEERGRQTYLENKKKQQSQATPNINTHSSDKIKGKDDELDMSKEAIFATLEAHGIDPN